jgi:hypothetical protein
MTRRKIRTLALVAVMATGLALPNFRAAVADEMNIEQRISTAKTAADHEAIAAYYEEQAKAARAKGEEHKRMSADYRKAGGSMAKSQLPEHCNGLAVIYSGAAKQYDALAAMHRKMAKAAK